ncbi:calcium-binding protein [Siccirubricoccus deserti]
MPLISGDESDNELLGTGGADTLEGLGGNDTLVAGIGPDSLDGGAGSDTVSYAGASGAVSATLEFVPGSGTGGDGDGNTLVGIEHLVGSGFGDDLTGSAAANRLEGGAGDDNLSGAAGNDTLVGGAGDDLLDGGTGSDTADYSGSAGPVLADLPGGVVTGEGTDTLLDIENITGSGFDDTIIAAANGVLDGGAGSDTVSYAGASGAVSATLEFVPGSGTGGDGDGNTLVGIEHLVGSGFGDDLTGSAAANRLEGGAGDDNLSGAAGNDTLVGGAGDDLLDGGTGSDTADYSGSAGPVLADLPGGVVTGEGTDTLLDIENVTGSGFDDTIIAAANGVLDGGAGSDTVSYAGASGAVSATLEFVPGSGTGGDGDGNTLVGIEHLVGSGFGDDLTGSAAANRLEGGAGDDNLSGAAGNDTLVGGAGDDLLDGGAGSDTADYSGSAGPVLADLPGGVVTGEGTDTLLDIENITGSGFDDTIIAAANGCWTAAPAATR